MSDEDLDRDESNARRRQNNAKLLNNTLRRVAFLEREHAEFQIQKKNFVSIIAKLQAENDRLRGLPVEDFEPTDMVPPKPPRLTDAQKHRIDEFKRKLKEMRA